MQSDSLSLCGGWPSSMAVCLTLAHQSPQAMRWREKREPQAGPELLLQPCCDDKRPLQDEPWFPHNHFPLELPGPFSEEVGRAPDGISPLPPSSLQSRLAAWPCHSGLWQALPSVPLPSRLCIPGSGGLPCCLTCSHRLPGRIPATLISLQHPRRSACSRPFDGSQY